MAIVKSKLQVRTVGSPAILHPTSRYSLEPRRCNLPGTLRGKMTALFLEAQQGHLFLARN